MKSVIIATEDQDVCIIPAFRAFVEAQKIANELKTTVTVRNAVTDRCIKTIKPQN